MSDKVIPLRPARGGGGGIPAPAVATPWRTKVLEIAEPYHHEAFRRYHAWPHPLEMLARGSEADILFDDPQFLAIAFHDAFCVPGAPMSINETSSALLMEAHARRLGTDAEAIAAAKRIIALTAHGTADGQEPSRSEAVVLDLDLMRLASPWGEFCDHSDDVHSEYRDIVPDRTEFMRLRAQFLKDAFGRHGRGARRVFRTALFDEDAAQANIARLHAHWVG